MRLVGVGLLALLCFAMVALLVGNRERIVSEIDSGLNIYPQVTQDFVTGDTPLPKTISGKFGSAEFPILEYDLWTSVVGFSSSEQFTLPLPRQTAFSQAVVLLNLNAVLEASTTGRLRVSINGMRRGEIVLNSGRSKQQIRIPLEPLDMAKDWINVSLIAIGNNPKAQCSTDWTGGIVISVEPTTKVVIALEQPLEDFGDKMLQSGSPARMIWRAETADATYGPSSDLSWSLGHSALDGVFVDPSDARDTDVAFSLSNLFALQNDQDTRFKLQEDLLTAGKTEWPVSLVVGKSDEKLREFRNRANWTLRYNIENLPGGNVPDTFHLDMTAVTSDKTNGWLLLVLLNGQVVHSEVLGGNVRDIQRDIPLPVEGQKEQNELSVVLTSDEKREGYCTTGKPAAAQLGANTSLLEGDTKFVSTYGDILAVTGHKIDILVEDSIDSKQANVAFYTLGKVFETSSFRYVNIPEDAHEPDRGLVKIFSENSLTETLSKLGESTSEIWIGFTTFSEEGPPEILVYKGDDPLLLKAIELYHPISSLMIAAPGFSLSQG